MDGLPRLEDGAGLLSRLGFLVQDTSTCGPAWYGYIAKSAEKAANQDLPTIDSTGYIHFRRRGSTVGRGVAFIPSLV